MGLVAVLTCSSSSSNSKSSDHQTLTSIIAAAPLMPFPDLSTKDSLRTHTEHRST
jgi:hypothetical protein